MSGGESVDRLRQAAARGGLADVVAERQRQIGKGYTPEHDDEHTLRAIIGYGGLSWSPAYYSDPVRARRELVRMAACLVAGIEWLDRREVKT